MESWPLSLRKLLPLLISRNPTNTTLSIRILTDALQYRVTQTFLAIWGILRPVAKAQSDFLHPPPYLEGDALYAKEVEEMDWKSVSSGEVSGELYKGDMAKVKDVEKV